MTLQQLETHFHAWIEYFDCCPQVEDETLYGFQAEYFSVPLGSTEAPPWLQLMGHLVCRAKEPGGGAAMQTLQRLAGIQASAGGKASLHALIDRAAGMNGVGGSHLRPSRVAALALAAVDPAMGLKPASVQEQLVKVWLTQSRHLKPAVSLPALLVANQPGMDPCGQPARIEFWLAERADAGSNWQVAPYLLRAPAISMLPADALFESGLQAVNNLLAQLFCADAPAVAFAVRLAPTQSQAYPPLLTAIHGNSFSAALAVGALWVLQQHLRPEAPDRAALLDALCSLHPERVVVTAGLGAAVVPLSSAWAWPVLKPVGGFNQKLSLVHAWPQPDCERLRLYSAPQQAPAAGQVPDQAHPDEMSLLNLILKMADERGRGLSPDQRRAHRLLLNGEEPSQLQWQAAAKSANDAPSLESWLVQRAGLHAAVLAHAGTWGPSPNRAAPQVQGDLLVVELLDGDSAGTRLRLDQLLHASSPCPGGWLVVGPAMAGKSTLLAYREWACARAALRRLQDRPGSPDAGVDRPVEVGVRIDLAAQAGRGARLPLPAKQLIDHVCRHLAQAVPWLVVQQRTKGLPPLLLAPDAGAPVVWDDGSRRHHVQIRLLIDDIDRLKPAARRALAAWLAQQDPRTMLPPLFTARDADAALDLSIAGAMPWQVARAELQPWGLEAWRAFVGAPGRPAPSGLKLDQQNLLWRRLALDSEAPPGQPTDFQRLCSWPGNLCAVCDLLREQPSAKVPETPGRLLLALLWCRLADLDAARHADDSVSPGRHDKSLPNDLLWASASGWPSGPLFTSLLVKRLMSLAIECNAHGSVRRAGVCQSNGRPPPWLLAAQAAGFLHADGNRIAFAQTAWQALFLALARNHLPDEAPLPDLTEPEGASTRALSQPYLARLVPGQAVRLPSAPPHHDAVRLAADVADDPANWVQRLVAVHLPLAAQVAIDHLPALKSRPGLLTVLRCLLLWRSLPQAPLSAAPMANDPLQQRLLLMLQGVDQERRDCGLPVPDQALPPVRSMDLSRRMQAALLLGMIGDTLRYDFYGPAGPAPGAVRLRGPCWCALSETAVRMAAFPVTQAEWDVFLASGDAWNSEAQCWQVAGAEAVQWLLAGLAAAAVPLVRSLKGMGLGRWRGGWSNPLLPVTDVCLHAARAYVAWLRASAGYDTLGWGQPDLPTEWEWHLAASRLRVAATAGEPVFNSRDLRWHRPSPVGMFAGDCSADGVADLRGNVRQWCGSALPLLDLYARCNHTNASRQAVGNETAALRGASYLQAADLSDPAIRQCLSPGESADDLGLRLVLRPG